jgi:23S rRNA pseudouridine955/2504/2580 synthase
VAEQEAGCRVGTAGVLCLATQSVGKIIRKMNDLSKAAAKPQVQWVEIGEEQASQRIDNFLLRVLKGVPKSHVYRVVRSGEVRVNSGRVGPDYRLKVGDRVRVPPVRMSEKKPPARPAEFPIVFEDAALLVVDKPAGVAVHGGSGVSYGVIESLRAARPEAKLLELAHRLDRDTSGLLIVAKKRSALIELHRMLRDGEIEKTYIAIVRGKPAGGAFEIDEPLHKYVTGAGERRVSVQEGGKRAVTRVKTMHAGAELSQLEVRLMTGRTHQIRVHLAHAGHPIVGDDKYGDFDLNRALAKRGAKRLMLHAARLVFSHPLTNERMKLQAPLPAEIARFAAEL